MSVVSEQAVLGHCLWNPADARQLLGVVEPAMLTGPGHASVGALLLAMLDNGIPVEVTTLASRLLAGPSGHLYQPNPAAWLHTLLQAAPRDINGALWHAGEVRKAAALRQGWQDAQYVADNAIPYNPLHDRGFPSIGCAPCTRAVKIGEPERAGRWWWENDAKKECGLHLRPRSPTALALQD